MKELSYNTPGLLFPAISLLMLAYTNRFFALASLVRQLLEKFRESQDTHVYYQIQNLQKRISLVRRSQAFGISSLIACILSLAWISWDNQIAWYLFGIALFLMVGSLAFALWEIQLSAKALEIEIQTVLGKWERGNA
ncbi:DUF2721 domain-containing protein [Leptospira ryugenii]|nr:DUF2721 domain-containing protein [Leptospira ryugenii]